MFLEHLTHIFGFNCEDKSFVKVFYRGDRPLFGLVNTIKHLENNFDKNIIYIYIFSKSYSLSYQNMGILSKGAKASSFREWKFSPNKGLI